MKAACSPVQRCVSGAAGELRPIAPSGEVEALLFPALSMYGFAATTLESPCMQ